MKWSGTPWAFFPQDILDGFMVSKWAPQYATEKFVVLLRYYRHCEPVPIAYCLLTKTFLSDYMKMCISKGFQCRWLRHGGVRGTSKSRCKLHCDAPPRIICQVACAAHSRLHNEAWHIGNMCGARIKHSSHGSRHGTVPKPGIGHMRALWVG